MKTGHANSSARSLADEIRRDIASFITSRRELMFNELDFQLRLALALLKSGRYDDIDVEYSLPRSIIADYDWDSSLRIDLVASRAGEYCPVELKHPTRAVNRPITRFGRDFPGETVMKNQGAQDLVRYNFWKDVRRLELLRRIFPAVSGGVAVMLTNDSSYTRPPRPASKCAPFSMHPGHSVGGGTVDWFGTPAVIATHPPFTLDGTYSLTWRQTAIDGIPYYYTILKI